MAKPILIIHAGTHKTGSTAIQEAFWAQREKLLKKGIAYPKAGLRVDFGVGHRHAHLRDALYYGYKFDKKLWIEMKREVWKCQATVLSHENFLSPGGFKAPVWKWLHQNYDVKLVVYLRPVIDYLNSKYKEWVRRQKFTQEPADFAFQHIHYCYYHKQLSRWAEVIGWNNILVREFSRDKLVDGSVVTDFNHSLAKRFKIDLGLEDNQPIQNESQSNMASLAHMIKNRMILSGDLSGQQGSELAKAANSLTGETSSIVIPKETGQAVLSLIKEDAQLLKLQTGVSLNMTPYKERKESSDFHCLKLRAEVIKQLEQVINNIN